MLRSARKLSQGELADIIHMHPTHIFRYERNQASPTIKVMRKISEPLTLSADQLFYVDSDQMAKEKIQDSELLNMFSKAQNLASDEVHCVKSLLGAYLIKSEFHHKFNVK